MIVEGTLVSNEKMFSRGSETLSSLEGSSDGEYLRQIPTAHLITSHILGTLLLLRLNHVNRRKAVARTPATAGVLHEDATFHQLANVSQGCVC